MFEAATGTKVEFLTEPYDSFFAKAFQDGTSKAGQYDIYIMDDPWIPQYAAAGILEDLGTHDIQMDADYPTPFADLGFWPPRQGPRVKGFETETPKLIALPTIGDLQTLTYRNDVFPTAPATWDDLVNGGKAAMASGKIKYGFVFRGVKGNPIVTSFYPVFRSFGADFFDDKWNPIFNSDKGKAAADFFVIGWMSAGRSWPSNFPPRATARLAACAYVRPRERAAERWLGCTDSIPARKTSLTYAVYTSVSAMIPYTVNERFEMKPSCRPGRPKRGGPRTRCR